MKKYISDEEEKYATFQNLGICSTIFKQVTCFVFEKSLTIAASIWWQIQ